MGTKLKALRERIGKVVQLLGCVLFLALLSYEFWQVPWRNLLTFQNFFLLFLCFLTTWLIARLDHGARLMDLICDFPSLIAGMFFSGVILFVVYSILKLAFEPS